MKKLFSVKKNYIFLFLLTITNIGFTQTKSINGTVNDAFGEPLAVVNIFLKGTVIGTTSVMDGTYILFNLESGDFIVEVSYVGFKTFTKAVKINTENITLDIVLNEAIMSLDDVVITGVKNPRSKIELGISFTTLEPS